MQLSPCSSCKRHVSIAAGACPFCGAAKLAKSAALAIGLLGAPGCDKQSGGADAPDPKGDPKGEPNAQESAGPRPASTARPERDEPADIYGGPAMMTAGPDDDIEKPVADDPKVTDDGGDDGADDAETAKPSEPVRAIYAGPPPREPEIDERKPEPTPE